MCSELRGYSRSDRDQSEVAPYRDEAEASG
jgi:hypothetical protein